MPAPGPLIVDLIAAHAEQMPDRLAAVEFTADGGRREFSWSQLRAEVDRYAALLLHLGVQPGENVAYQLPNQLEFVVVTLAALRIGAVCEPLMPIFRERELEFMINRASVRIVVVPGEFRGTDHEQMALSLLPNCPTMQRVIVLGKEEWEQAQGAGSATERDGSEPPQGAGSRTGEHTAGALDARKPKLDDHAQLLFTSGTSGEPKGVLNTHRTLNVAARAHIDHFGLTGGDVIYAPSPMAHQTGFLYGMWMALMLGAPLVFHQSWDAELGFRAVTEAGVTFVQAATPFLADLVRIAGERDETPEQLRFFVATGAAIPRELARQAREVLGAQVGGGWGSTETCMGAAFVPGEPAEKAWSADGRALGHVQIRIVDDEGTQVPANTEGNFELHSPTMFSGYLERDDLTAQAFTADGYYRTGDLARIDADGYLHITGRVKDVVNRGGEKVPVAEVEQILYGHPAVAEVAIVAMPDARLGERACAFVVPAGAGNGEAGTGARSCGESAGALTFAEMQQYLDAQKVSKTYWPERLELVDDLPRTPSGKVQKYLLREQVAEIAAQGKAVMR